MVWNRRDVGYTDHRQRDPLEAGVSPAKEGRVQRTYQAATSDEDGSSRGEADIYQVSHGRFSRRTLIIGSRYPSLTPSGGSTASGA